MHWKSGCEYDINKVEKKTNSEVKQADRQRQRGNTETRRQRRERI